MSSTLLLPPREHLCNRSCSNKTHTHILPARTANQYLTRHWFAVRAGKIGSPVCPLIAVRACKIGSPVWRFSTVWPVHSLFPEYSLSSRSPFLRPGLPLRVCRLEVHNLTVPHTEKTCRSLVGLWTEVLPGNVGIQKALRRCQKDARRPSRRSSPRIPSLLLQCRQFRTREWGWLPGAQLGCGFLFLTRFGERPRGAAQRFIRDMEKSKVVFRRLSVAPIYVCISDDYDVEIHLLIHVHAHAHTQASYARAYGHLVKSEHGRGGAPAVGAPATWKYVLRCA
jgi:hypothetical protein